MAKTRRKRHPTILRSPPPKFGPGDTPVWTPGGESPGPGTALSALVVFLDKNGAAVEAGLHAKRLRPWARFTYPPGHEQYALNIQHRQQYGEVGPWFTVTVKPSRMADLVIAVGSIGKGAFTLVFRIKDEAETFTLIEEKQSLQAQAVVGEFKQAEGRLYSFDLVQSKMQYLAHIAKAGHERWLSMKQSHQGV